ncbi:MAG: hypothetical protein V7772_04525 [Pseudomonas profundi]|uniref:hypothetical protein n=1 Tax=Pseudomonas profundi TaxID=1981513 RepID=UPI0030034A97
MNLYVKGRDLLIRRPLMAGITVAAISFVLLNLNKELFIISLPSLLLFLPCLLMLAVCMRPGKGKKGEQQAAPAVESSNVQNPE